ncbi:MAG: tyrosine/phenylalanine carboxypeptidase domain-containing protein [Parcubacteria group bacterium]|jgi:hypothetical protein
MNKFEVLSHREKPENIPGALDDLWYKRFKSVGAFQDFEYLTGKKEIREEQKKGFFAGEIENPTLDYPELDNFDYDQKEQRLLLLKKEILSQEKDIIAREAYHLRINEQLAVLRMLKAARAGDDRRFCRYSRFIYGSPEEEIYQHTIYQVKEVIEQRVSDADPDISAAAVRLKTELLEALIKNENTIDPKAFNLPEMKTFEDEKTYSAEEMRAAFEKYLNKHQIKGWRVLIEKEGKIKKFNVSQQKRTINIPSTRKEEHSFLLALLEHEIGTHIIQREKGERSKLKLLGMGLDRSLKGEEGIATYREQKIRGTRGFRGLDYHLAISLALGLDGEKRDFRKVFEIMRDYHFVKSKKSKDAAIEAAKNEAWDDCVRIFRGTTCKTPGACLTRDIVYREGNIGIWRLIKEDPATELLFSIGKYDPTNPRHVFFLKQLAITDGDLKDLEK